MRGGRGRGVGRRGGRGGEGGGGGAAGGGNGGGEGGGGRKEKGRGGREDGNGAEEGAKDGDRDSEQRQREREERNRHEHRGGALDRAVHRENGEHEADEEASGIAQEDACGAEVVARESDQRADEDERDDRDLEIAEHCGGGEDRRERDDGDARGETVEAIDEIEGVCDGDDPKHRERDRDPAEVQNRSADAEDLNTEAEGCYDKGGDALHDDLGERTDASELIDEAGADALRFAVIHGATPGNDQRFGPAKLEHARNFANKLWNATRFVAGARPTTIPEGAKRRIPERGHLGPAERWLLSRAAATTRAVA